MLRSSPQLATAPGGSGSGSCSAKARAAGAARPHVASCRRRSSAAARSSSSPSSLPAAWPLLSSSGSSSNAKSPTTTILRHHRRHLQTRAAAASTEAAPSPASTSLLPPPAAALLPAVERALAAVAAAASADGAPAPRVAARVFETSDGRGRVGLVATADAREGECLLAVPEALAATAAGDAGESAAVAEFLSAANGSDNDDAPAVSELVALALWVMAESGDDAAAGGEKQKQQQQRDALLSALPRATLSPVLWPDEERAELLRGSPVLQEARDRERALREQWATMSGGGAACASNSNAIARQGEGAFLRAFCAVVASAAYLPSAGCFALVPVVSSPALRRTCAGTGAFVDYDASLGSSGCAVLRCGPGGGGGVRAGQEVTLEDGRPNAEFLLATGDLPGEDVFRAREAGVTNSSKPSSPAAAAIAAARIDNPQDFMLFPATLLAADRLYAQKAEILAAAGLEARGQAFPVRRDALPTQLLSYLRLARVQDAAQFARVSFDADVIVSQMNEYEVLQLLMGDCRERLSAYETTLEEECKLLQGQAQEMGAAAAKKKGAAEGVEEDAKAAERRARERLAARLRAAEKAVLSATTDAVRRRLAPIRGIPTKSGGMQDPNSDLREIFEALEGIPSAPARALDTVRRWAKGEFDPDWNKR